MCHLDYLHRHVTFGRKTLQLVQEYEGNQPLSDFFWVYRWGGISDVSFLKTSSLFLVCFKRSHWRISSKTRMSTLQVMNRCPGVFSQKQKDTILNSLLFHKHESRLRGSKAAPNPGYVSCSQSSVVWNKHWSFLHKLHKCDHFIFKELPVHTHVKRLWKFIYGLNKPLLHAGCSSAGETADRRTLILCWLISECRYIVRDVEQLDPGICNW